MQEKLSPPATGRPKLFYGWIVVLGCALMMGTSIGLFVNCNGIFIKPVCEDLGFTRGAFTLYASIASFVGMFMQVVYGNLYQKYPMLPFSRVSIFVVCSCVLGYSFATKLWHFYALAVLYGLLSTPILTVTIASLVSNWFVDKKGLAMGLAYSGSGVTAAIMTPILSSVVQNVGWRWGYRLLAVTGFAVLFVSVFVLLREKPSDMGLTPLDNHSGTSPDAKPLEPVGQQTADAAIANDQHPGTKQRCRQLLHGNLNGSLHRGHCIFDGQFLSLKIVINAAALFPGRAHKFRVQFAAA